MLKLIIEDDEGRKTVVPFVRDEITIGRQEGNTIRLTERNVSRRHARLQRKEGRVTLEDLGSYNGIRLNGERIHGQVPLNEGDVVEIGDYDLAISREEASAAPPLPRRSGDDATHPLIAHDVPDTSKWAITAPAIQVAEEVPTASEHDFHEAVDEAPGASPELLDAQATAPKAPLPPASASSRGLPLFLGLLGLVAGAGIAVWFLKPTPRAPAVLAATASLSPPAPTPPVESAAERAERFTQALGSARVAIAERRWDEAKLGLEACLEEDGSLWSRAAELLRQLEQEAPFQHSLDLAEKALAQGDFEKAGQLLNDSQKTELLAVLHLELTSQWEDALAKSKKSQPPPLRKPAKTAPPLAGAQQYFDEGVQKFRSEKLEEARAAFEKCLRQEPSFAACHKGLGGVYARMGENEKGATHYRAFLKLAPDDKDAPAAQAIIDAYEAGQAPSP